MKFLRCCSLSTIATAMPSGSHIVYTAFIVGLASSSVPKFVVAVCSTHASVREGKTTLIPAFLRMFAASW
jgi:hypothetical protein